MIRMKVRASVKKISPDDKIVRRKGRHFPRWRALKHADDQGYSTSGLCAHVGSATIFPGGQHV